MAGMAASVALFRRNIDGADRDTVKFDRTTQDVGRNIDKLSGRLGLLVDVAATLGPALIPTAAAAVPLLAGLSNQLGFVAIAGGSTILAFQGVGDALKALNEQQLHPSAANLAKLHETMATLGPAGRDFVRELQAMRPELQKLQTAAQAGLFPGMTEGIESLMTRMPQAERIIGEVTDTVGGLLADAGKSLASHDWDDFFNMLESEARPTLQDLGESIGQVTKGLADLWVAFAPLNRDFSQGFLDASKSFADWADGLSQTQGFADFVAYLDRTGPQVAETLGALSKALLDVLEAASPLGGPALAAVRAFANAISAIANSDLGPPLLAAVAAMRAYSLATTIAGKATRSFVGQQAIARTGFTSLKRDTSTWLNFGAMSREEMEKQRAAGERVRGTFLKGAAGAAALGLATSGMADKIGVANTATLGLAGAMIGPWGAAAGAGVGAFLDLKAAGESFGDTLDRLNLASKSGNIEAISKQIAAAKAQVADINKTSGVGDFFSDIGKSKGASLANLIPGASISSDKADQAIAAGQLSKQYSTLAATVRQGAAAARLAAQGFNLTAAGAKEAAGGVNAFAFAIRGANAALTRQGTLDAYRTSLLDMADALKTNGKTLNSNTRAGLANRAALRGVASSALEAAGNMKNFANRTKFLDGARKSFINLAVSAGMTRAAAKRLADQLGLLDRIRAQPKIILNDGAVRAQINGVQSAINNLHGKTIVIQQKTVKFGGGATGLTAKAGGGTILGQRDPYGDKVLVWAAPGEEYITNRHGEADQFRADRAAGRIPHYAGGGTIQHFADGGEPRRHPNRNNDDHDGHNKLRDRIHSLTHTIELSTKAIDKERSARDDLVSKRNDLASTVGGNFLTDPFGASNVWAPGGGNPLGILKADIAKANAFRSTLYQLKKKGLDGEALASIASTGDLGQAQALLSMGKSGLGQFESAFTQRAKAAAAVGAYAGNAVYGQAILRDNVELKAHTKHLAHIELELKHLRKEAAGHAKTSGKETGKAINHAASKAKRRHR